MNVGLLVLRVVVGGLFVGHGAQKLFGWFGGHGLRGTGSFFESLGYWPGRLMAALAGLTEFGAGLLLALGLLTPIAAAGIIGTMVNAMLAVHLKNGMWNTNGGMEFPIVMAASASSLAFTGPGRFSLDRALGLPMVGHGWGVAALLVGVGTGLALYFWRTLHVTAPAASEEQERRAA